MKQSARSFTPLKAGPLGLGQLGLLATISLILSACGAGLPQDRSQTSAPAATGGILQAQAATVWQLTYADDFNGGLDTSKWIVNNGPSNVNGELQYYTPEDVYVQGGNLVLRTQKRSFGGRDYSSGEVRTGGNLTVTPGSAVEWRTKVPKGKGIWPANWLLNDVCEGLINCPSWPPEIDVMEMRGSKPNQNVMTHWWDKWPAQQFQTDIFTGPDFSQDFHTYRVEWLSDKITWYIDGVVRATHTANVTTGSMQLIMNTAVGGSFDGSPDGSTTFPQYQLIDYVRVFKKSQIGVPTGYKSLRVMTPGFTNRYARHAYGLGNTEIVDGGSNSGLKADATFKIMSGLADGSCYSFEARNFPGQYLRHANSRVRLDAYQNADGYRADATFCASAANGGGVRFSAINFPGNYLRHANSELWMASGTGGSDAWNSPNSFQDDTRWSVDNPWAP
ncbi:AbfB domain-containing protein [Deinococcus sp.]|uniref:AbfB domain-containing protein n=1 Tax=Deinococcus sp. TaxID=47478 RepID=UPI003B5CC8A7